MVTITNIDVLTVFIGATLVLIILPIILRKQKIELRRLPAVDASEEALRACAERGTSLFMGSGTVTIRIWTAATSVIQTAYTPAVLELLKYLSRKAAELGVRVLACTHQPLTALMMRDYQQQGYMLGGRPDLYSPGNIYFFPDYTTYGIGTVDLIHREKPAGGIHISYTVWGTNAVVYEALARHGAFIVAGDTWPNDNSPAVIAADQISWGEENIVLGTYLKGDPIEVAGVFTEDLIKMFWIASIIVLGVLKAVGVI